MKIIGITYHQGQEELILKGDSSLLVNRKPFFIPDYTKQMQAYPIVVMRVCKLGKDIAPKFASRYVDAIATGYDLQAADLLEQAAEGGHSWTGAIAMDGSCPVGDMLPIGEQTLAWTRNGETVAELKMSQLPLDAITRISQVMTIRQGDLIAVAIHPSPILLQAEDTLQASVEGEENMFCRIK